MNRIEYVGARLVMLLRWRDEASKAWDCYDSEIRSLQQEAREMHEEELYQSVPAPLAERPAREIASQTVELRPNASGAAREWFGDSVPCPGKCDEVNSHLHYENGSVITLRERQTSRWSRRRV